jgi:hypothetical protein
MPLIVASGQWQEPVVCPLDTDHWPLATFFLSSLTPIPLQEYDNSVVVVATASHLVRAIFNGENGYCPSSGFMIGLECC